MHGQLLHALPPQLNAPLYAAHEFKDALADLEEDVASITLQLEQLEQHTTQAISVVVGYRTGQRHAALQPDRLPDMATTAKHQCMLCLSRACILLMCMLHHVQPHLPLNAM